MPSLNTGNAILSNPIKVDSSYNVGIGGAASGSYKLQVTGTTNLTGALTGTSGTFSGNVNIGPTTTGFDSVSQIASSSTGNIINALTLQNTSNTETAGTGVNLNFGGKTNWIGRISTQFVGATGGGDASMSFLTPSGGTLQTRLTIASTGAATFSSSVTANSGEFINGGQSGSLGSVVRISTTNTNSFIRNWAIVNTWDNYGDLTFRVSNAQGGDALAAGSTKMVLLQNGNLGIATSSPQTPLQILKDTTGNGTNIEESNMAFTVLSAANQSKIAIGACNAGNYGYIQVMQDATSWTNRNLTLQPRGGSVGIGTYSPTALLHLVQSTTNLNLYLQNTSGSGKTWAVNSDSNGVFNIHDTATNYLSITSNGTIISTGYITDQFNKTVPSGGTFNLFSVNFAGVAQGGIIEFTFSFISVGNAYYGGVFVYDVFSIGGTSTTTLRYSVGSNVIPSPSVSGGTTTFSMSLPSGSGSIGNVNVRIMGNSNSNGNNNGITYTVL